MRVLAACEFSGTVRNAFISRGHDAWSCDLEPSLIPGPHIQDDVLNHLDGGWDLIIAFPPCTHLCNSGAWAYHGTGAMEDAIDFVGKLWASPAPMMAIENPVGVLSTRFRKPDQYIQPWEYGHGETKKTCLWLRGLPPLTPTRIVRGRDTSTWLTPGIRKGDKARYRSITFPGIADAMAEQWGIDGCLTRSYTGDSRLTPTGKA